MVQKLLQESSSSSYSYSSSAVKAFECECEFDDDFCGASRRPVGRTLSGMLARVKP